MRISELATRAGVPVATVKYYLREGLLPPGEATSATQAVYDERHVERLKLVRVLREVGRVPVANLAAVLAAVDDPDLALQDVLATAHHALMPIGDGQAEAPDRATAAAFVAARGWRVSPDAPALVGLASALSALARVRGPVSGDVLACYGDAAETIAQMEIATLEPTEGIAALVADVAIGTVVFEQVLIALRRLAQEHFSGERFGRPAPPASPGKRRRTKARST